MHASVVIPLWNGAEVIEACIRAIYQQSGPALGEVIVVDNASSDGGAALVTASFPQARLLAQPVNLGFAGGVNAGMAAARHDLFVLVNQDCLVELGWLDALIAGLDADDGYGIAGCTILNADGSVNHAGATLDLPLAYGRHLTEPGADTPRPADYVTGAIFAVRRTTWDAIGAMDEGFYPAYFEETDYCFRARHHGIAVGYVPRARARHLFSSRAWQQDPIRHLANQHQSRYRFVAKHFASGELGTFFVAEAAAIEREPLHFEAVGRLLGARSTLRALPAIVERAEIDRGEKLDAVRRRQLEVGFTHLWRASFAAAQRLMQDAYPDAPWSRFVRSSLMPLLDRATGGNSVERSAHRTGLAARTRLLEILAEYEYR